MAKKPNPHNKKRSGKPGSHRKGPGKGKPKREGSARVQENSEEEGMRLNKYVAHCGVCSRRQAADHVKNGLVTVNREVVKEPFYQVQPGDIVAFKDEVIRPEIRKVYFLMNKPKNTITTVSDDRGRRTVMDIIKNRVKERVFPVGRLDRATTGLLLLTNDGDLAQKMMHPSYVIKKIYHVHLDKPVDPEHIKAIRKGITLEDGPVPVDEVNYLEDKPGNQDVGITLHIGRNRIVRRTFEHFGYQVEKLDRVYLGGLTKKDLPRGFVRPLKRQEIIMLKHFTGKK
jgi:23S rRNA pseudouridine2605 synthase